MPRTEVTVRLSARHHAPEENDMYSDLIIGFDGSDAGHDGLAFGRRLAQATGGRPTVVFARSYSAPRGDTRDSGEELSWDAVADQILDEARAVLADVPGATFRAVADPSAALVLHSIAESAGAALIVLGSTHRTALGRVVPGTTADHILHDAPCAVAVAPAGFATRADDEPLGRIGVAVDGGAETERVARVAGQIARAAGATLRLITVAETPHHSSPLYDGRRGYASIAEAIRERAGEALERATAAAGHGLRIERVACEGKAAAALLAETADLDLLVVGSRGYGPVRSVLLGSVSRELVRSAACPVVVLPRGVAAASPPTN
jgi:nucleotide-binding universal stress UspA family protein